MKPLTLFTLCSLLSLHLTLGQTFTWTGSSNQFWDTTSANWSGGGTLWVNGSTSDAVFAPNLSSITLNADITANTIDLATGNIILPNGRTLTLAGAGAGFIVSGADTSLFRAPILGNVGLTVTGDGTGRLDLYAASTYTGATVVTNTRLSVVSGNDRLPVGTDLILNGTAVFLLQGNTQQIGALTGDAGTRVGNGLGTPATLQIEGETGAGSIFSGRLAPLGTSVLNIVKLSDNTQILEGTGSNTYSGTTQINNGTLIAAKSSAFGTGAVTVASGGTWGLQNNITQTNLATISGAGETGRAGAINNISGNNVISGALTLAANTTVGTTAGTLALNGGIDLSTFTGTFATSVGSPITIGGDISGSGDLVKTGNGVLNLSGANTYTGDTFFSGGILSVSSLTSLGAGNWSFDGGTLDYVGGTETTAADVNLTNDGAIQVGAGGVLTISGVISGANALNKVGPGVLTLAGANTFSGGSSIDGGTLRLESSSALGAGDLTVLGSTIDYADGVNIATDIDLQSDVDLNVTIGVAEQSGLIYETGGPFGITKIGAGQLLLSAPNTFTGDINVNQGTLLVSDFEPFAATGDLNLADGVTFGAEAGTFPYIENRLVLAGDANLTATGGGELEFGGEIPLGSSIHELTLVDDTFVCMMGSITGSGGLYIRASDITMSPVLEMCGLSNSYTGLTRIGDGVTLYLTKDPDEVAIQGDFQIDSGGLLLAEDIGSTINQIAPTSNALIEGELFLEGLVEDYDQTLNQLTGSGFITNGNTFFGQYALDLTINSGNFSGVLREDTDAGALSLLKETTGLLVLSGTNTYTGSTEVNAGTLQIDGSLANTSGVSVASGATLGGTGTISAPVTINDGGILAPGTSPGTITVTDLILNNASVLEYELGTPGVIGGGVNDLTSVSGDLTLDGVMNITQLAGFGEGDYRLFNYGNLIADNDLVFTGVDPGIDLTVTTTPFGEVNLSVAATNLQYWDGSNTTPNNVIDGGDGDWTNQAADTNWTNSGGNANSAWSSLTAVFTGTAGSVTIPDGETIGYAGMHFITDGYEILNVTDGVLAPSGDAEIEVDALVEALIDAPITGTGGVVKTGAGDLFLTNENTFTGNVSVNEGGLYVADPFPFDNAASLTLADGVTFGTVPFGASLINSPVTITGDITLSADFGGLAFAGNVDLGNATRTISLFTDSIVFTNGVISGTAGLTLRALTPALQPVLTQTGPSNTYTGLTTVGDGAALYLSKDPEEVAIQGDFQIDAGGLLIVDDYGVSVTQIAPTANAVVNGELLFGGFSGDFEQTLSSLSGSGLVTNGDPGFGKFHLTLTVESGNFSGDIGEDPGAGRINLVKDTAGTLILSGANTYTGKTSVLDGELRIDGSIGNGKVTVAAGGTLSGTGVIGGQVRVANNGILAPGASAGTLTTGTLLLNRDSALNYELDAPAGPNDRIVVNGNLRLNGRMNITDLGGITNGTYRIFDYTGTLTDKGLLFGTAPVGFDLLVNTATANQIDLEVEQTNLQYWDGANLISNGTVNGGTGAWTDSSPLATNWTNQQGNANNVWSDLTAVFTGLPGTVTVSETHSIAYAGLRFLKNGYTIDSIPNGGIAPIGLAPIFVGDAISSTVAAPITGSGGVQKLGLGELILSGNNTFTGGMDLAAGTTSVTDDQNLGSSFGNVNFSGGTLHASSSFSSARNSMVTGTGEFNIDPGHFLSWEGQISGTGAITKSGAGTLTLLGNNTYSGPTTITAGEIIVGVGDFRGALPGDVVNNGTLTFNRGFNYQFDGDISGTGSVQQNSSLTMTGDWTHTGGTIINLGTLNVGNGGTSGTVSGDVQLIGNIRFNRSDDSVFSGQLSGDGGLSKAGTGSLRLTGANTYSGSTDVVGELKVASTGSISSPAGSILVGLAAGDTGVLTLESGGTIQSGFSSLGGDPGAVGIANISGNWTANTLFVGNRGSGELYIQPGGSVTNSNPSMIANNPGSTGSAEVEGTWTTPFLFVGSEGSGTLEIQQDGVVSTPITVLGFSPGSSGMLTLSGSGTNRGVLETGSIGKESGGGSVLFDGGAVRIRSDSPEFLNGFVAGDVVLGGNGGFIDTNGFSAKISSPLSGVGGLTKLGTGVLTLSGENTYTGGTTIDEGALVVGFGNFGSIVGDVLNNSVLRFERADSYSFDGAISGSGDMIHSNGILTLTGVSSYTGTTSVNSGTLVVDGELGNTALAVAPNAFLKGSGTILGSVSISDGGFLSVIQPQTLSVGSLSFSPNARIEAVLTTPNGSDVLVDVAGNLRLDGSIDLFAGAGFGDGSYRLFDYGGVLTGDGLLFGIAPGGYDLDINTSTPGRVTLLVAQSDLQYWNGSILTPNGSINGGDGIWNSPSTNWTNLQGNANSTWLGRKAVFAGNAGIVTLGENIGADTLRFDTSGYVINGDGNVLNLSGNALITGAADATINATITGLSGLRKEGTGTVTLGGSNSYFGATMINEGTLIATATGALGSGTISVSNGSSLVLDAINADGLTITNTNNGATFLRNGATAGANTNIVNEDGGYTSLHENSSTGLASITNNAGGSLFFHNRADASAATVLNNTGGSVDLSSLIFDPAATGVSIGSLSGAGDVFLGKFELVLGVLNRNDVIDGEIQDGGLHSDLPGGSLVKVGFGALTLNASNSYSGTTRVESGRLVAGADYAIPDAATVVLNGGELNLGQFQHNFSSITGRGTLAVNQGLLILDNLTENTFDGTLTGKSLGVFTKIGEGNLTLNGNVEFEGQTFFVAGSTSLRGTANFEGVAVEGASLNIARGGTSIEFLDVGIYDSKGAKLSVNGGTLTTTNAFLGYDSGVRGTVNVQDGSDWNTDFIIIGDSGGGIVNLRNGGRLVVGEGSGVVNLATSSQNNPGTGVLNIGGQIGGPATAPGILSANIVTTGDGVGTIHFNHTGTEVTPFFFTSTGDNSGGIVRIEGSTNVLQSSGVTALSSSSTYTGTTTVAGGTLVSNATQALGIGDVVITGGSLRIASNTGAKNHVTLFRPGLLEVNGSLEALGETTVTVAGGAIQQGTDSAILSRGGTAVRFLGKHVFDNSSFIQATGAGSVGVAYDYGGFLTNTGTIIGESAVSADGPGTFSFSNLGMVTGDVRSTSGGQFFMENAGRILGSIRLGNQSNSLRLEVGSEIVGNVDMGTNSQSQIVLAEGNESISSVITGEISHSGSLLKQGKGTWRVDVNLPTPSGVMIAAGRLIVGDGDSSGSISGDVINEGGLIFDRSDTYNFAGAISGGGSVEINGGRVVLSGANSYTGTTVIEEGALQLDGSLLASDVRVRRGSALQGGGNIGGTVTLERGNARLLGARGSLLRMGHLILKSDSLVNVALGAPSSAAMFNVTGNLQLDGFLNVSDAGGFTFGTYRLLDYGGELTNNGLTLASLPSGFNPGDWTIETGAQGRVDLSVIDGPGIQYWDGTQLSADGTIAGGDGVWNNSNTNWTNFSGTINAPWAGQVGIFTGIAGVVTLGDDVVFETLRFDTPGYEIAASPFSLLVAANSRIETRGETVISASISGAGGLTKLGSERLVLAGTNTFEEVLMIEEGTLELRGTLLSSIHNKSTLVLNPSSDSLLPGAITGSGEIFKRGGNKISLSGANSMSGETYIEEGTLELIGGGRVGGNVTSSKGSTFSVDQTENSTLGANYEGAGDFAKNGPGILTVNQSFNHTGGTRIEAGILRLVDGVAMQSDVLNQSELAFDIEEQFSYAGVIRGNGLVRKSGAGIVTLTADQKYSGQTQIVEGALQLFGSMSGDISNDGQLILASESDTRFSGVLSGHGNLIMNSSALAVFSGENSFTGQIDLNDGELQIGDGGKTGSLNGVFVGSGGILTFNRSNDIAFTGSYTGVGDLRKLGAGTLTINSSLNNNGMAFVEEGTLEIRGRLTGEVSVFSGAALTGSGRIRGGALIQGGGMLSGRAGQVLTLDALNLQVGSSLYVGLGAPSDVALFEVEGALNLNGSLNVTDAGGFDFGRYRLINYGGELRGFGLTIRSLPAGFNPGDWRIDTGTNGLVDLAVVSGTGEQYWDGDQTSADGAVQGGDGIWNNSLTNWTNEAGNINAAWASQRAVFSGKAGTVTLGEDITFTGLKFVTGGYSIVSPDQFKLSPRGIARVEVDSSATIAASIVGEGGLNKRGEGRLILLGENTYTGGTSITGGAIQVGDGGGRGSIISSVSSSRGGELVFNRSDAYQFEGTLSGGGALRQIGSGELMFTSTLTHRGPTTVENGTLVVDGHISRSQVYVIENAALTGRGVISREVRISDGATLRGTAGETLTMGGLTLGRLSRIDATLGAPSTTPLFAINGDLTLAGLLNVRDAGGFYFGSYRLMNYTGKLSDVGLTVNSLPEGFNPGDWTINTHTKGRVSLQVQAGPGSQYWDGTQTAADGAVQGGDGIWNNSLTNWTNEAGDINAAWASQRAVFSGEAGTVTLGDDITFTGLKFVTGGYSIVSPDQFKLSPRGIARVEVDSSATIAASIVGEGGLNKSGEGRLILLGENTYTGGTSITGGAIQVGDGGGRGSIISSVSSSRGGKLIFNRSDAYQFEGLYTGGGALRQIGSGDLMFTSTLTHRGPTTVENGTLVVDGHISRSQVSVFENAALTGRGVIRGGVRIADGATLRGAAGETLTMGGLTLGRLSRIDAALGAPSTTPLFAINGDLTLAGLLNVRDAGGFNFGNYRLMNYTGKLSDVGLTVNSLPEGFNPGDWTINTHTKGRVSLQVQAGPGSQYWDGTQTTPNGQVEGGDGIWDKDSTNWTNEAGTINGPWASQNAVFAGEQGTVTLGDHIRFTGLRFETPGYLIQGSDRFQLRPSKVAEIDTEADATIAVSIVGDSRITKTGPRTLVLTGANAYRGGTFITEGTLQIGDGGRSGLILGDIDSKRGTRLEFQRSGRFSFDGDYRGQGDLAITGRGTMRISGTNTHTGGTRVDSGKVILSGSLGKTDLVVGTGARFTGTGTVAGSVEIEDGASLQGAQGKVLTVGSLSLNPTSLLNVSLGAPSQAALFDVTGNLTLDGLLSVEDRGGFNFGEYRLVDYQGKLKNVGLTIASLPEGFNPGDWAIDTNTKGKVNLVVSGGSGAQYWDGSHVSPDGKISGGDGVWNQTATNWTNSKGNIHAAWVGEKGIFTGEKGRVKLGSDVEFTGLQFETAGYTILGKGHSLTPVGLGTISTDLLATLAAPMVGKGGLVKTGPGTLVLASSNSYLSGTTIAQGVLQVGTGRRHGSLEGNVLNLGVLEVKNSGKTKFEGAISGSGVLRQTGSGNTTLLGANSYTGGTEIGRGSITVGGMGTLPGDVANEGELRFERSSDYLYSGKISGSGDVIQESDRTLVVVGDQTYTGTTFVRKGSLILGTEDLEASLAGNVVVEEGAYFGGVGKLGGNFTLAGINSPGYSPGNLFVKGDFTLKSTAVLVIEIDSAKEFDRLKIGGRAKLGGTLQILVADDYQPVEGTKLSVLKAKSLVGKFAAVEQTGGWTLKYRSDKLALIFGDRKPFQFYANTPNQKNVAAALEALRTEELGSDSDFNLNVAPVLAALPPDALRQAFDVIAPQQAAAFSETLFSRSRVWMPQMAARLADIRNGVRGFTSSGFAERGAADLTDVMAPVAENKWGVWLDGSGVFNQTASVANLGRGQGSTGTATVGADYRISDHFMIGLYSGYIGTWTDFGNRSEIDSTGSRFGIYSTYKNGGFYLNNVIGGELNSYDWSRQIQFPGINRTASADTSGAVFETMFGGGYDWRLSNAFTIGAFSSIEYTKMFVEEFTESGAGSLNLRIEEQEAESLRTNVGLQIAGALPVVGERMMRPSLRVAWRHEYLDGKRGVNSALKGGAGPGFFTSLPAGGKTDSLLLNAGFSLDLAESVTGYLYYTGDLSGGSVDNIHSLNTGLSIEF